MTDTIVRCDDLHVRRGGRLVLAGASFGVSRGDVVALMGPSGAGKTTILRAIAALDSFERGTIEVDGVSLDRGRPSAASLHALRQRLGMVFQFHCLFEHMSALENVSLAPMWVQGLPRADAEVRARELLRTLDVEHRAAALPCELSGGEAQRVAIARALAVDPPVLLLDEPTASLDPARRLELASLLRTLVSRRRTLLVATHDEDFAAAAASSVLRVEGGKVHE